MLRWPAFLDRVMCVCFVYVMCSALGVEALRASNRQLEEKVAVLTRYVSYGIFGTNDVMMFENILASSVCSSAISLLWVLLRS